MEQPFFRPVETQIGVLVGRDAIYLNSTFYDGYNLIVEGSFNGHLASKPTKEAVFYRLTFSGVLALRMTKIDSLYHSDPLEAVTGDASCFDEIVNSSWIAGLGGKVTPNHKHYHFGTYDDTFEIACESYELKTWITYPFVTQKG